uniref:Uncharacterized protein n=1 Tax=Nelumbo nucifera TaxID=4432 RepID=A0A822ZCC9_NELNU|nr:TPA_asm: hypothetical protein HUJ06_002104 [Nelumbo nucifera]
MSSDSDPPLHSSTPAGGKMKGEMTTGEKCGKG